MPIIGWLGRVLIDAFTRDMLTCSFGPSQLQVRILIPSYPPWVDTAVHRGGLRWWFSSSKGEGAHLMSLVYAEVKDEPQVYVPDNIVASIFFSIIPI